MGNIKNIIETLKALKNMYLEITPKEYFIYVTLNIYKNTYIGRYQR